MANTKTRMLRLQKSASRREKNFDLTKEQVEILLQQKECAYTGVPVAKGTFSIDRIDNSKGYLPGNVIVASIEANSVKGDTALDELLTRDSFGKAVDALTLAVKRLYSVYDAVNRRDKRIQQLQQIRAALNATMRPVEPDIEEVLALVRLQQNIVLSFIKDNEELQDALTHRTTLEKFVRRARHVMFLAQIHKALMSGEIQNKANQYFGITDNKKPPQKRRFFKFIKDVITESVELRRTLHPFLQRQS